MAASALPHGDAEAWIALRTHGAAPPAWERDRAGIEQPNTGWADRFTLGGVEVTLPLRAALVTPPAGMPLVDHRSRRRRGSSRACAT